MPALDLRQTCWNHEAREAVCRCPQCFRSFCRECVSEHEGRLLCAACLRPVASAAPAGGTRLRRIATLAMFVGGFFLGWLIFFGMGKSLLEIVRKLEEPSPSGHLFDKLSRKPVRHV
jgi:hypothetical protein